ncbi:MAG: aromatic amino acid hydroxylase [candidate division Zixibacteria bacterium]|nr:aromatic amino acid hydroxylase [candidate division Zixibacteria bacterium]
MKKSKRNGAGLPGELAKVSNQALLNLPNHLKQFIVDQQYAKYTPIDHSVWRYVMRQNYNFLKDHAHKAYVQGLERTGISLEHIPSIVEMNHILDKIGWAAVSVDGFIPPAAFMEFQAYRVLVVAADMRQIEHIEYTPAPDIIHEAAGHAPIIADAEYAEYLRRIGEYGARAMSSKKDFELYQAIRHLSILKELPNADPREVEASEKDVDYKQKNLGKPSEMALISRLHWWTVEYGLIGDLRSPKLYGAGLLSSIGESFNCLSDKVKKIPYTIDTQEYAFDITTQQPQLFVTPTFQNLLDVLEQFADTMSFRRGGMESLAKAIECENVATAQLSSGLQVSGVFSEAQGEKDQPVYIKTQGPSSLAYGYKELPGHGKDYHKDGFGTPVGRLEGADKPLESFSDSDLAKLGIKTGSPAELKFKNGVNVNGKLEKITRQDGKILFLTFSNCKVTRGDKLLFDPQWGAYDMGVGETVESVFCNAADKDAYEQIALVPKERTIKITYDDQTIKLQKLYQKIRDARENGQSGKVLKEVWDELKSKHPHDWLLSMEILEIVAPTGDQPELEKEIRESLEKRSREKKELHKLIEDGLSLIYQKTNGQRSVQWQKS